MASIQLSGMDELLKKLENLSNKSRLDEIAIRAVNAAKPLNEAAMRSAIASVEYGPYSTGSISRSVTSTPAKVNEYGVFSAAHPTGRDQDGFSNDTKAVFLQYGTSKLQARPWRQKAVHDAEKSCKTVMEEIVKKEMELE